MTEDWDGAMAKVTEELRTWLDGAAAVRVRALEAERDAWKACATGDGTCPHEDRLAEATALVADHVERIHALEAVIERGHVPCVARQIALEDRLAELEPIAAGAIPCIRCESVVDALEDRLAEAERLLRTGPDDRKLWSTLVGAFLSREPAWRDSGVGPAKQVADPKSSGKPQTAAANPGGALDTGDSPAIRAAARRMARRSAETQECGT